jgi:hypothetical protein
VHPGHWSEPAQEQLGTVNFPNSCSAAAQETFQRGVAMLHSFRYGEAEKTFREVLAHDPSCAIATWGIAAILMSNPLTGIGPRSLRRGRGLRRSVVVGRNQEHARSPDAQDFIGFVGVRRRDQHPGAVTRRHEHRVRVVRPHVPCAVSRLQAPAQDQPDTATDRAPENAKRLEQGAESHQEQ